MKKTILSAAALMALGTTASAQLNENFNNGIPSTWSMINDGQTPSASLNAALRTRLTQNAWAAWPVAANDSAAITTSWFDPAGTADRWLISPSFTVTAGMSLMWDDQTGDPNFPDSLQVLISPTAGTTASDFTQTVWNDKASTTGAFATRAVSLNAYVGQTIRVAFRNHTTDAVVLFLDNVRTQVLPPVDAALTRVTPPAGSPAAYGATGGNITIGATVFNYGNTPLTSYNINYQVNGGAVVSQPMTGNIPTYSSANVTFATPYSIPGTASYNVVAWVDASGDANHSNDTARTMLGGYAFMPKKRVLLEEGTGTWCGWCPRGAVYMDSISKVYPNDVSLVAVHNGDPMTVTAYDSYLGTLISGYPTLVADRAIVDDPSEAFNIFNALRSSFGFADMTLGTMSWNNGTLSVPVDVKAATNLTGDYRLSLIITEDGVQNATGGGPWSQVNYYSGKPNSGSYSLPTTATFGDFHTLPSPIPANQIHYDFVARSITPSPTGSAGMLPASMTANTTYNATLTAPIDASWDRSKLRAIVVLMDNATGTVLNTANSGIAMSVANVDAGISKVSVYPNPTTGVASASVQLDAASKVNIEVSDITGRVIATVAPQTLAAGEHIIGLPVSNLSSGLYNVKISTAKGSVSERLSIVK